MLRLMGKAPSETPDVLNTRMWWLVAEFYPLTVIKDEEKYTLRESTVWPPKKPKKKKKFANFMEDFSPLQHYHGRRWTDTVAGV